MIVPSRAERACRLRSAKRAVFALDFKWIDTFPLVAQWGLTGFSWLELGTEKFSQI